MFVLDREQNRIESNCIESVLATLIINDDIEHLITTKTVCVPNLCVCVCVHMCACRAQLDWLPLYRTLQDELVPFIKQVTFHEDEEAANSDLLFDPSRFKARRQVGFTFTVRVACSTRIAPSNGMVCAVLTGNAYTKVAVM